MSSSYVGFANAVKQLSPYDARRSQLFSLCSQAAMVARAFSSASERAPRTVPETSVHPHGSTTFHIQNADPSRPKCSRTMEWSCRRRGVIGAKLWQRCLVPGREPGHDPPVSSKSQGLRRQSSPARAAGSDPRARTPTEPVNAGSPRRATASPGTAAGLQMLRPLAWRARSTWMWS